MSDDYSEGKYQEEIGIIGDLGNPWDLDDEEPWESRHPLLTSNPVWTTRDGRRVTVREMTSNHLLNTIQALRGFSPHGTAIRFRTKSLREDWLQVLYTEALRRGGFISNSNDKADRLREMCDA